MKTLVTWTQLVGPSSAPGKTETGLLIQLVTHNLENREICTSPHIWSNWRRPAHTFQAFPCPHCSSGK